MFDESTVMRAYRRRPINVDAIRWTGENEAAVIEMVGAGNFHAIDESDRINLDDPEATGSLLSTAHRNWVDFYTGNWVVRNSERVFALDDETFQDTYEPMPADVEAEPIWRAGNHNGRTLYRNGECVGQVDTPKLGAQVVAALNAKQARTQPPNMTDADRSALRLRPAEREVVRRAKAWAAWFAESYARAADAGGAELALTDGVAALLRVEREIIDAV
jgi:hypothetical protein